MHRGIASFILLAALVWLALGLPADAGPPKSSPPANLAGPPAGETEAQRMELVRATVAREFGSHLTLVPKFPPMFGDFDGDGAEDLAVVVSGNPVPDAAAHDYKLIDPYDSFFGYGDAKVMLSFPVTVSGEGRYVAIVHQWRAAHPKMKFVIVNLPFEQIQSGSARWKKKLISALFTIDSTGLHAQVFWDGHKYRWMAGGFD